MEYSRQSDFEENGFVFCESFFDSHQVDKIVRNVERFIRERVPQLPAEHVFYEDKTSLESLKQIQKMHEYDPFFEKLMNEGAVRQLAESLLGTEVTCENMQYFNKPPGAGLPTPPHQDGYYFKLAPCEALTIWLALDEVDDENGCVRYVVGSHRMGMRSHGKSGTLGFSQGIQDFPTLDDENRETACPARPGDLLAHHALTIHRAEGNRSSTRSRRALGFIYYSVNAKQDEKAWRDYQSALNSELRNSGRI